MDRPCSACLRQNLRIRLNPLPPGACDLALALYAEDCSADPLLAGLYPFNGMRNRALALAGSEAVLQVGWRMLAGWVLGRERRRQRRRRIGPMLNATETLVAPCCPWPSTHLGRAAPPPAPLPQLDADFVLSREAALSLGSSAGWAALRRQLEAAPAVVLPCFTPNTSWLQADGEEGWLERGRSLALEAAAGERREAGASPQESLPSCPARQAIGSRRQPAKLSAGCNAHAQHSSAAGSPAGPSRPQPRCSTHPRPFAPALPPLPRSRQTICSRALPQPAAPLARVRPPLPALPGPHALRAVGGRAGLLPRGVRGGESGVCQCLVSK